MKDYLPKETIDKILKTTFKKGNVPKNHREVGSERINVDGFIEIKVSEPSKWRLKSRVMYEQYHNVKLTSKDVIIYLDGNKLNLEKDNLKLITRKDNLILNNHKLRYSNKEATESGVLVAKLMGKVGMK